MKWESGGWLVMSIETTGGQRVPRLHSMHRERAAADEARNRRGYVEGQKGVVVVPAVISFDIPTQELGR